MLQHETRRPRYTERNTEVTKRNTADVTARDKKAKVYERNTEVTKRNTADVTARDKKAKVYGKEHRGYEKEHS